MVTTITMRRRYPNPISKKRRELKAALRELNRKIWLRDQGRCIRCGSTQIFGKPYSSGSHHIVSRGVDISLLLAEENNCLLCMKCHDADADTVAMRCELFLIMEERYPQYNFRVQPYLYYLEQAVQI